MKTFLVGGAVRDKLMGIVPKDLDYVVVGGTPEQMLKLGFNQVGADFPVFLDPQTNYEYALARTERKTGEGYIGFSVQTQNVSLCDDLARRDLTINSMAMDDEGNLYDPYLGKRDLDARVLRHTSDAYAEDPLRVIRLARFYARYHFKVADETFELSRSMITRGSLNELSVERFWAELSKVFQESRPDLFFELLYQLDGDLYVHFFRDLYGHFTNTTIHGHPASQIIKDVALAVGFALPQDRVMLHVALTALGDSKQIQTADSRTRALHANVNRLRKMPLTTDGLFDVLKHAKAWSVGHAVDDLWKAIVYGEIGGLQFKISPDMLREAVEVTKTVYSADYVNKYEGKALGEAIDNGRKAALQKALNL